MSRHGYIDLYFAGGEYWTFYICDFEKHQKMKWSGGGCNKKKTAKDGLNRECIR